MIVGGPFHHSPAIAGRAAPPPYEQSKIAVDEIEPRLSAKFTNCIKASGGVTADMQDCNAQEYPRLDRLLNMTYSKAMQRLPNKSQRAKLRDLQRGWLEIRWDTCRQNMDELGGGSASVLVYGHCRLQEVIRRTIWLERQTAASIP